MKKRGQFYLLAAMIIIVLIGGFAAVSNYAEKTGSTKVYDLKEELNIETGKVLDHGVLEGVIPDIYDDFVEKFSAYVGENQEIYFIFGNEREVTLMTLAEIETGDLIIVGESSNFFPAEGTQIIEEKFEPQGNLIEVELGGVTYEFKLKPGENFFFIISQELEGEQHVAIS